MPHLTSEPAAHEARPRTRMAEEAAEAPRAVRDLLTRNAPAARALGAAFRSRPLRAVLTCARGSSDHAATYAKHLIETRAGLFTASAAPSVSSIYEVSPQARDVLCLAISQS
ncbi:MAG: iron dicitrate transport regulator FecR, partial [Phenylobacterium sp.]